MLVTPETRVRAYKQLHQVTETKVLDKSEGIVSAIVNTSGNRDTDGDVIVPGAYAWGLALQTPKGARFHDKTRVVARALSATEVLPGDKTLPGSLLSAGLGGMRIEMQYNLKTQDGNDAFETVKFFADEQEWSVGYEVGEYFIGGGQAKVSDDLRQLVIAAAADPAYQQLAAKNLSLDSDPSRFVTKWLVYEWSDVMFGANGLAQTEGVKDAGGLSGLTKTIERLIVRVGALDGKKDDSEHEPVEPTLYDARLADVETSLAHFASTADADMKAGRVQATRNVTRLRAARDAVQEMLDEIADDDSSTEKGYKLQSGRKGVYVSEGIEGTFEDTVEDITEALRELFVTNSPNSNSWVSVQGTFADHVVVDVCTNGDDEYFDVPWAYAADGETITLGKPQLVDLVVNVVPDTDAGAEDFARLPKERKMGTKDDPKNHDFAASEDDDQVCSECSGKPGAAWHNKSDDDKQRELEGQKALRESLLDFVNLAAEQGITVEVPSASR